MPNRVWPRTATILTLAVLLLLPGGASAAPSFSGPARLASPSQILFQGWSFLTSFWGESGCRLDPNGACVSSSLDNGCSLDPSGNGCRLDPNGAGGQSFVDAGCSLDPSGAGCVQDHPFSDNGCRLDPDGRCADGK
jgi:hypothetical protein